MPNTSHAADCICPFYIAESGKAINCEGLIRGTVIKNAFDTEEQKNRYQERVCMTGEYARRCMVARVLEAKYKKTESEGKNHGGK